jgi:hypothetical protein
MPGAGRPCVKFGDISGRQKLSETATTRAASRHTIAVNKLIMAAVLALSLTGCIPATNRNVPAGEEIARPSTPHQVDPLSDDGTWLVPSEIKPGVYRGTPSQSVAGYVAVCTDAMCRAGAGMIKNWIVNSPQIIAVPENAYAVELQRTKLVLLPSGGT